MLAAESVLSTLMLVPLRTSVPVTAPAGRPEMSAVPVVIAGASGLSVAPVPVMRVPIGLIAKSVGLSSSDPGTFAWALGVSGLAANAQANVPGSELLNPTDFAINPIGTRITGTGATLSPDAPAITTGTADISGLPAGAVTGTLVLNGTNINVLNTDSAANILQKINAQTGTTGVTASLNASNHLVLTGPDAVTNTVIGGGS